MLTDSFTLETLDRPETLVPPKGESPSFWMTQREIGRQARLQQYVGLGPPKTLASTTVFRNNLNRRRNNDAWYGGLGVQNPFSARV